MPERETSRVRRIILPAPVSDGRSKALYNRVGCIRSKPRPHPGTPCTRSAVRRALARRPPCGALARRRSGRLFCRRAAPRRPRSRSRVPRAPGKRSRRCGAIRRVRPRSRRDRPRCLRCLGRPSPSSGPGFLFRGLLPALELRLALLHKSAHTLAGVPGGEKQGELVGLVFQSAYEVYV